MESMCLRCFGYAHFDIHLHCITHSCQVCKHMAQQTSQILVCTTQHLGTHTVQKLELQLTSVSMMLPCVIVKTVRLVDLIEMRKTGCFGETRLVPHIP